MKPTLLAVFAHPDDEAFSSGGVLAHYAALGVRVVLVSATRGEAGQIFDPNLTTSDLGKHRELELRRACEVLGIEAPRFMGYHDSGRLERLRRDDPLATINIDYLEMESKILDLIEELEPQVLLTFDPHGGYGHPDHLSVQRAAHAAFFSSGQFENAPKRLFYTALTIDAIKLWVEQPGGAITPGMTAETYGVSEETIAVRFDISAQLEKKLEALKAHGSQTGQNSRMGQMPPDYRERFERNMRLESFALGGTRGPIARYPMRGFFEGLGFDGLE
jgi:N-acetyl-1-D-myo-inositol-2-amino-2-deoxy-alpha-D-glucopyranoside deacetylase